LIKTFPSAFQKWVQEAQAESELDGGKNSKSVNLASEPGDNLHWIFSVESYLRSLDIDWSSQKSLTNKIAMQLLSWIKQFFHFQYQ